VKTWIERWRNILEPIYKVKWYVDTGVGQVSWFSGKLPEVMSVVFLAEYLGFPIPKSWIIPVSLVGAFSLFLLGLVWKRFGLYDAEVNVGAYKNPVTKIMLDAANKINASDKL